LVYAYLKNKLFQTSETIENKKGRLIAETTCKVVGMAGHLSNLLVEELIKIDSFYTNCCHL